MNLCNFNKQVPCQFQLALENPALDVERAASGSIDAYQQDYAVREQDRYLTQRQNNDDDTPGGKLELQHGPG